MGSNMSLFVSEEVLNATSRTFSLTVDNKGITPPIRFPDPVNILTVLEYSNIAQQKTGKLLINTSPINPIYSYLNNSLIGSIYAAYNQHYKLVLRPDDIWLTIVITLADYIDTHAEEMRSAFVTHSGKEKLEINVESVEACLTNWIPIIKKFSDEIANNTVDSVRDWIEPNFTTTTDNDRLIGRVALMGAIKNYFDYSCNDCCGLPEVTLMGTLNDWQELRLRIDRLAKYGKTTNQPALVDWRDILFLIIDEFIASYKGKVNNKFWQSCANHIAGGSGPSYVSGWVLTFAPFKDGKWRLNTVSEIKSSGNYGKIETGSFGVSATIEVPVRVNGINKQYDAILYAGGIVNTYNKETNTICPSFDFAMFELPENKEQITLINI